MSDHREDLVEPGLQRPLEDLKSVLIPAETLEAWAVQRRLFALTHRRILLAATSGRLLWIERGLLGGFDVSNVRWQDLEEVSLHVGIFGARLIVRSGAAADLASEGNSGSQRYEFRGLRKAQAQAVYRICQAQDQAWREKRRIRELEELRARSGGFQIAGGPSGGYASAAAPAAASTAAPAAASAGGPGAISAPSAAQRLLEAKQLLDARLISDSEYEAIKARIVSGG
jgi:hypothetical protein